MPWQKKGHASLFLILYVTAEKFARERENSEKKYTYSHLRLKMPLHL